MRFRFIPTPDFHRDMPFMGMRRVYSRLVATLRDATTPAFDNLVKAALGHSLAFVVKELAPSSGEGLSGR